MLDFQCSINPAKFVLQFPGVLNTTLPQSLKKKSYIFIGFIAFEMIPSSINTFSTVF